MGIPTRFIGLILVLLIETNLWAATILYPGTFDPFHVSHQDELLTATKKLQGATVLVAPIETAYYARTASGKYYPKLFPYEIRTKLIREAMADYSNVEVVEDLKDISQDVFWTIRNILGRLGKTDAYVLVGVDVLQTWQKIEGFQEFLRSVRIIVSFDHTTPQINNALKQQYQKFPGIMFIEPEQSGVRAADVKKQIISNVKLAKGMLPASTYNYFVSNEEMISGFFELHRTELTDFLNSEMRYRMSHMMAREGVNSSGIAKIQISERFISEILSLDFARP